MKRWMILATLVVCLVLLKINSGIFALPAAFMLCIALLWSSVATMARSQLNGYRQDIEKKISDAEQNVLLAQDFLQSVQKTEKDLLEDINSILQSAHQEAAFLLKKAQNEVESLQENHRRQIELQGHVLRQKWRLSMGQELVESMQKYIASSAAQLPNNRAVLDSVSKKACHAIGQCNVLPKNSLDSL
jgi:F0F1-type ATP synthase membrane subunit b/b'